MIYHIPSINSSSLRMNSDSSMICSTCHFILFRSHAACMCTHVPVLCMCACNFGFMLYVSSLYTSVRPGVS